MSKITKTMSQEAICQTPSEVLKDNEKIFTTSLLVPIALIGAFLVLLNQMSQNLFAEATTDPFKRVWVSGPIFFTCFYLLVVYFGVEAMKTREEFKIKPYIFAYNLYQCVFNILCVAGMVHEVYSNPWFTAVWGNTPQPGVQGFRISWLVWLHYNNKYLELLDTLWMILRKKNGQISFLHCYHHVLLIWAWFLVCKIETGGDCYFGATVNSFIHVIMYGYYTLALLNISCPWKKWITNCQMFQFALCLAHSTYVAIKGNMPIALPLAQGFVMVNMLVLFSRFYAKSYGGPKKSTSSGVIAGAADTDNKKRE